MSRLWPLILALAVVIVGPMVLRPKGDAAALDGERKVIVVSPHNEAIRAEFGRAFREWYRANTGKTVTVDWRTPGGTSEVSRYLTGAYFDAFRQHWTRTLGRQWNAEVEGGYANPKLVLGDAPEKDTPAQAAHRAFRASKVSIGIDVFFGGGSYDFIKAAGQGMLVDCGYLDAHRDLFGKDKPIPPFVGGEPYFDEKGRWFGTTIGAFGIACNRDQLARLGLPEPRRWADLADPRYFRSLALANPTQSGSANKAFEMLIQQQMNEAVAEKIAGKTEDAAVADGWQRAMRLLQRIGANARYFTDSSSKIALDVEAGEATAGMTIDFYGRFQSESVRRADGSSRIGYTNAEGGTSFGVDPIGLLRGAPHPEEAHAFIKFVMTDGQKLWGQKAGTPGGPRHHALRRLPILPALYTAETRELRSDPDVLPYEEAKHFTYIPARSSRLFDVFAFVIRVMCIDTHDELTTAWRELIAARERTGSFPAEALAAFEDVSAASYEQAKGDIAKTLGSADKIGQVRLAKTLAETFAKNYRRAADLARAAK